MFTIADHKKQNLYINKDNRCPSQTDCTRTANANCTKY